MKRLATFARFPWLNARRRSMLAGGLLVAVSSGLYGMDWAEFEQADSEKDLDKVPAAAKLLREGSLVMNAKVEISSSGERITVLLAEGQRVVPALENLASQRVLKAVSEDPADNQWIVDGQITEFNDRNFILLQRVKRHSRM